MGNATYWRYLIVFLAVSAISLWFLDGGRVPPIVVPDTQSYQYVVRQIRSGAWPDLSFRQPVYPFYMAFFGASHPSQGIVLGSVLLGAAGSVMLYWILDRIFHAPWATLAAAIFLFADYGIIQFENVLAAESIGPVVLLFSLWTAVYAAVRLRSGGMQRYVFPLFLLSDMALMYYKPQYILLPLVLKGYLLLHVPQKRMVVSGLAIDIVLIAFLMASNVAVSGKPVISENGGLNMFGKALQAGLLDGVRPQSAPSASVRKVVDLYYATGRSKDPYDMLRIIQRDSGSNIVQEYQYLDDTNAFLMRYPGAAEKYLRHAAAVLPDTMAGPPDYYVPAGRELRGNPVFAGLLRVFRFLNGAGLWGIGIGAGTYMFLRIRRSPRAFLWGLLMVPVMYTLLLHFLFVYTDAYRLRVPVAPLINLCTLSPVLFAVSSRLRKPKL